MKKLLLTMLAGLMVFCFSAPVQGRSDGKYESGNSYHYGKTVYKYNPYGKRHYYKHERRILKEIRKNQRRILKLERKLGKLKRRRHYRGHYKHNYYTRRIRHLRYEIRRLERRNHYLRRLLHR